MAYGRLKANFATVQVDPEYPLFQITPLEAKYGADTSRYRSRMQSGKILDLLKDEVKVAEILYHKGGKMSDFGYRIKEGIDQNHAFNIIIALMHGKGANHIQKDATIALAIFNWYEKIPAKADA